MTPDPHFRDTTAAARALFSRRNALLEQASAAYAAGDGHIAQRLSLRGQEQSIAAHKARWQSARSTFWGCNYDSNIYEKVDFHGLQVAEALSVLGVLLEHSEQLEVVTGIGAGKLRGAVHKFCWQNGHGWRQINAGTCEVQRAPKKKEKSWNNLDITRS